MPIGSMVTATKKSIVSWYQEFQPKGFTEETFVEAYQFKQSLAVVDTINLKPYDKTPKQIKEELSNVIGKAKRIHQVTMENSSQTEQAYISLLGRKGVAFVDGSFRVSGLDFPEGIVRQCAFCNQKFSYPASYAIMNITNNESISFSEITLHFLDHDYFPKPGL